MSDNLPPLPEPTQGLGQHQWAYSAEDLRAYAAAAVAERDAEIERLKAEVKVLLRYKGTAAPRLEALAGLLATAQIEAAEGKEARATLASERAANAILTAEVEALRAHAERYRWLRDPDNGDAVYYMRTYGLSDAAELDAAIDRARGKK